MSGVVLHMKIIEDVRRLTGLNLTDRAIARAQKMTPVTALITSVNKAVSRESQ